MTVFTEPTQKKLKNIFQCNILFPHLETENQNYMYKIVKQQFIGVLNYTVITVGYT